MCPDRIRAEQRGADAMLARKLGEQLPGYSARHVANAIAEAIEGAPSQEQLRAHLLARGWTLEMIGDDPIPRGIMWTKPVPPSDADREWARRYLQSVSER